MKRKLEADDASFAPAAATDCWTSRSGKGYHGGCLSYVSNSYNLVHLVLGARRMKGTKNHEALVDSLRGFAQEYGITCDSENIFFAMNTDTGGADNKAGDMVGHRTSPVIVV